MSWGSQSWSWVHEQREGGMTSEECLVECCSCWTAQNDSHLNSTSSYPTHSSCRQCFGYFSSYKNRWDWHEVLEERERKKEEWGWVFLFICPFDCDQVLLERVFLSMERLKENLMFLKTNFDIRIESPNLHHWYIFMKIFWVVHNW